MTLKDLTFLIDPFQEVVVIYYNSRKEETETYQGPWYKCNFMGKELINIGTTHTQKKERPCLLIDCK